LVTTKMHPHAHGDDDSELDSGFQTSDAALDDFSVDGKSDFLSGCFRQSG
jgi:hypothetical protein